MRNKIISMVELTKVLDKALGSLRQNKNFQKIECLLYLIQFWQGLNTNGATPRELTEKEEKDGKLVGMQVASCLTEDAISDSIRDTISKINTLLGLQSVRKGRREIALTEVNTLTKFFETLRNKYARHSFTVHKNIEGTILEKTLGFMTPQEFKVLSMIYPNQDNLSLIANKEKIRLLDITAKWLTREMSRFTNKNHIKPLMEIFDDLQEPVVLTTTIIQRLEAFQTTLQSQVNSMYKKFNDSPARISALYPKTSESITQLERTMIHEIEDFQNILNTYIQSLRDSGVSKVKESLELNTVKNELAEDYNKYALTSLQLLFDTLTEIEKLTTKVRTTHFITLKSNDTFEEYCKSFLSNFEVDPIKKTLTWLGSPITEEVRFILNTVLPDPVSQQELR
ncbi:MAG: hypothetical protein AABZ14_09000, partial [Candidatus Margulisiibacteriota bacterium]